MNSIQKYTVKNLITFQIMGFQDPRDERDLKEGSSREEEVEIQELINPDTQEEINQDVINPDPQEGSSSEGASGEGASSEEEQFVREQLRREREDYIEALNILQRIQSNEIPLNQGIRELQALLYMKLFETYI